jgi:acyl-coenzyme A thioesterase PaaI-like protein
MKAMFLEGQRYRSIEIRGYSFCVSEDVVERADEISLLVSGFNNMPFHKLLGLELVVIERERIVAAIEKTEKLSGHIGLLHGGVIAACLDGVGAFQAMHEIWHRNEGVSLTDLAGRGRSLRTSSMQLDYLSAPRCDWFQISASTANYDASAITVEMQTIDPGGRQVARGRANYVELFRNDS